MHYTPYAFMVDYSALYLVATEQRPSLPQSLLQWCSKRSVIQKNAKPLFKLSLYCHLLGPPQRTLLPPTNRTEARDYSFLSRSYFSPPTHKLCMRCVSSRSFWNRLVETEKNTIIVCHTSLARPVSSAGGEALGGDSKVDISGLSATTWFIVRLCRQSLRRPGTKDKV